MNGKGRVYGNKSAVDNSPFEGGRDGWWCGRGMLPVGNYEFMYLQLS
ncbi:hypothetical protein ACFLSA_00935 [Bacteroidota bacterium]